MIAPLPPGYDWIVDGTPPELGNDVHDTVLIGTIAAGIGVAFILGLLAARFGLPPLVGYLVAGIVVGPFTPGYVADSGIAGQLAEFGVILLMFGVGLHFSFGDLVAVRRIVVPGALLQTTITTTVGAMFARLWGSSWGNAVVLGLCLGKFGEQRAGPHEGEGREVVRPVDVGDRDAGVAVH